MSRPKTCNVCKRTTKHKTSKGRCLNCAMSKNRAVVRQMRNKKGKYYKKWKLNLLNAMKKQPM